MPILNGVVLIREGRIAAVGDRSSTRVPNDARVLDCSGLTITAGFWNSHVHFIEEKWRDAAHIPAPTLTRQLEAMLTVRVYKGIRYNLAKCRGRGFARPDPFSTQRAALHCRTNIPKG